jgi:AraC-like DNA-binding protein
LPFSASLRAYHRGVLSSQLPRSAASARLLLELAYERELDAEACLHGTGLSPRELAESGYEIRSVQEERLIANIVALVGPDSDFAVAAGRRYRLEIFGMLGFACMSAPTLREMLDISLRYQDLAFTLARARAERDAGNTYIVLSGSHLMAPVRRFAIEQCMSTVWAAVAEIDSAAPRPRVDVVHQTPGSHDHFAQHFGAPVRYGCAADRIGYPDSYLDRPRPQIDPAALLLCERECRDMIARRRARVGMVGFVRELLTRASGPLPSMETVASDLNISVRTLRRALAAEGTTFRDVDESVRRDRSVVMLLNDRDSVEGVARALGYATTPAFVRAFKRWHGMPPGAWRAARHPEPVAAR